MESSKGWVRLLDWKAFFPLDENHWHKRGRTCHTRTFGQNSALGHAWRSCVDYWRISAVTKPSLVGDALDRLGAWFSSLDLQSGFWQMVLTLYAREQMMFTLRNAKFEQLTKQMPQGPSLHVPDFQRGNPKCEACIHAAECL